MKGTPYDVMTPPELILWGKMIEWDRYFADMRFETRTTRQFLKIKWLNSDGSWRPGHEDVAEQGTLCIDEWELHLRPYMKAGGWCNGSRKAIFLRPNSDARWMRTAVLHEMIHAYEAMLPERYRQILCFVLREKLRGHGLTDKKFIELLHTDNILANKNNSTVVHTVLFMLKALALDLQLHLPLGTVHSYGREEHFKHFRLRRR